MKITTKIIFDTCQTIEELDIEEFRSIIWSNPTDESFVDIMSTLIDYVDEGVHLQIRGDRRK